ncbi:MAG: HIRAN domain-containing protein [Myxococcota bacterium]
MERRRFFTRIGTALAAVGLTPVAAPTAAASGPGRPTSLHLQDCRIAGSHHYECFEVLDRLRVGDTLRLVAEPDNPYDRRAVEVFWGQHKLGYLPRVDNAAAASLAERGHTLRAEVLAVHDPDDAWEPVRLRVRVEP